MKELDFLPEWYKDNKRRHSHMRKQYVALVAIFLVMMAFNATATHRAGRAAASVANLENQCAGAEAVVHEFAMLTKRLNDLKTRANLVEQLDSRVDVAALLAEMSHIIDDSIVLRKVEILAEPFGRPEERAAPQGAVVRLAGRTANADKQARLGQVRFRIALTGVAAHPANVPDLVFRLENSAYFHRVDLSFYGNAKAQVGGRSASGPQETRGLGQAPGALDVTEFEIVCYLANYKDTQE